MFGDFSVLGPVAAIVVAVLALVVFLLPTYVAFHRKADERWIVLVVNVLFGATFVGWVVALILATRKPAAQRQAAA
ncbi:superinfection immunity protein [Streptomyces benahoarensis]|uniref:superinfection immunity protein n=1 Tax=Streptomyces benahoarensis TaxID=2595054 RepID=UPI00163D61EE|nr:superinfection immunity protein [Streptomyces benahoarensis]